MRGVAAVEFALLLPLLLVITFGAIEFSLAWYDKAIITNASREAARAGIVYAVPQPTTAQITTVAQNYCQSYLLNLGKAARPFPIAFFGFRFQTIRRFACQDGR